MLTKCHRSFVGAEEEKIRLFSRIDVFQRILEVFDRGVREGEEEEATWNLEEEEDRSCGCLFWFRNTRRGN